MGLLDPKALRDWIKSRAVNNLMATVKGFFLDARLGPVIQNKIDEVKTEVEEINGNLNNVINVLTFDNIARDKYKENLLTISVSKEKHDANKTRLFLNPTTNSPITGTFFGVWRCLWFDTSHVLVKAEEFYPVQGRVWTNFYNTSAWSGWKSITPQ